MRVLAAILIPMLLVSSANAQYLDTAMTAGSAPLTSAKIVNLIAILSVLSIAPSLLVMMTSFTRIVIALSFLRTGLGLQSTPANIILVSLALFMTFLVMSPVAERAWREGVQPLANNSIAETEAIERILEPFREFMTKHVRDKDLKSLGALAQSGDVDNRRPDLKVLVPAFMLSELRRGFEIGFLIALPFLVIDLIVATITMSMGMMMLPPSVIALPVKVLFFVLIDGWSLLIGSLIRSYN